MRWKRDVVPEEPPVMSATGAMGAMIGMQSDRERDYSCSCIDYEGQSNIILLGTLGKYDLQNGAPEVDAGGVCGVDLESTVWSGIVAALSFPRCNLREPCSAFNPHHVGITMVGGLEVQQSQKVVVILVIYCRRARLSLFPSSPVDQTRLVHTIDPDSVSARVDEIASALEP